MFAKSVSPCRKLILWTIAISMVLPLVASSQAQENNDDSFPAPQLQYQQFTPEVPEKYQSAWELFGPFYSSFAEGDDEEMEIFYFIASLLPDSIKHPAITPIALIVGFLIAFVGGIWFLVSEFRVSLGWGFGQLAANAANCVLGVSGIIVAIIFLCMHWYAAKNAFLFSLFGWALLIGGFFFIPSWAVPQA